jgi:hypothetical protein
VRKHGSKVVDPQLERLQAGTKACERILEIVGLARESIEPSGQLIQILASERRGLVGAA